MTALPPSPAAIFSALGLDPARLLNGTLAVRCPIDGSELARLQPHSADDARAAIAQAQAAFTVWRDVPAPRRGELVRLLGEELRASKTALGALVTLEVGKLASEGEGEVQEMIDICDFAVGLSRQLHGLTIASERPGHRMMEQWHPLGVVGIISAFNFPVAVWSWNSALALVCGNPVIWKPSDKTPLTALATQALFERACARFAAQGGPLPPALSQVLIGGADLGEVLADDARVALLSATGSTRMGRAVAPRVAARFGRCLLELGGNNAIIVAPSADLDLALRGIAFGAAGTAGQRCTTTRRLLVHEKVVDELQARLVKAYGQCKIGNPFDKKTLVGPLIDEASAKAFDHAVASAVEQGGKVVVGGKRAKVPGGLKGGAYVEPTIVRCPSTLPIVKEETFAPILYIVPIKSVEEAIALNNDVPQGLSSSIFTLNARSAERFVSAIGSDCGIANVNIGTSGAEIGGAFGGEKETGGGRESGSDSWKIYMRRQTSTVNWGTSLPLAQGITFGD
jgi:aldehyde dehydrogenase (NAD+)